MKTIHLICLYFFSVSFNICFAQQLKLVLPVGHNTPLEFASYSPNGKYVATAALDHNIKIWETATGFLLHSLPGHTGLIGKVKFSNNGKLLASASSDGYAKIWDAVNGNIIFSLKQESKYAIDICFSPDDKELAVTGNEGAVKIWDVTTGNLKRILEAHHFWTYEVTYSPDGKYIATAAGDNMAKIFDAATGNLLHTLFAHSDYVTGISFSPDNKYVLTGSRDNTAKIFSVANGNMVQSFEGNTAKWSADGKYIVTISDSIRIWDAKTGVLKKQIPKKSGVHDIDINSKSSSFVVAFENNTASVFDIVSAKEICVLNGHRSDIKKVSFDPAGDNIMTASYDGTSKIWRSANGELLKTLSGSGFLISSLLLNPANSNITSVASSGKIQFWDNTGKLLNQNIQLDPDFRKQVYSPDGKIIAAIYRTGQLELWNVETKKIIKSIQTHADMLDLIFSPDGKKMATFGYDHNAKLWDVQTGELLQSFSNEDDVFCGNFNNDGTLFLTGSKDLKAKIWQTATGKLINVLEGHQTYLTQAVFNNNGRSVLTCSMNKAILWNTETGKKIMEYEGKLHKIFIAVFSSDGKYIITGAIDGYLQKWETYTGILVTTIPAHTRSINKINCTGDGNNIFTTSDDNTIKVWNAETLEMKKAFNTLTYDISINQKRLVVANYSGIEVYSYPGFVKQYEMIPVDSGYITTLPDGYYLGEKSSASKLYYVKGLQTITFEQLDVKYNRPDKVLEGMGSTDTALIRSYRKAYEKRIKKLGIDTTAFRDGYSIPEADFANRYTIQYEQKAGKLKLQIKSVDSIYKLDRFNIWVNETPLYGQRGISLRKKNKNNFDSTITIDLSQGENRIEASITNVNGTESYRMPLLVNNTPANKQTAKTYFIGIGIDRFNDSKYNLKYSTKDIRDLAKKLKEKYKDIIIDTLFNENVTISNVKALKQKLLQTNVNDKVIISYSGHGMLSRDFDYYLSTYAVNFEKPEENGLPYDELESLLDSIPARKKLMLIDACHSGEVDKDDLVAMDATDKQLIKGLKPIAYKKDGQLGLKNSFELMQTLFVNVGKSTGATIISAAAGTEFALEGVDNLPNGVFTYCILEAMNTYPTMKISELKKRVGERVIELTKGLQKPTSRNETIAVDWEIW